MKELFLKFRDLAASIDGIKMADRDKGQLEYYETKPGVSFPCVLIKINITGTRYITKSLQECKAQVIVRVAHNPIMSDTASIAPDASVERSLQIYDLTDAVYLAFEGYTDDEVEDLELASQVDEDRRDGYTVVKMVFSTSFQIDKSGGDL